MGQVSGKYHKNRNKKLSEKMVIKAESKVADYSSFVAFV